MKHSNTGFVCVVVSLILVATVGGSIASCGAVPTASPPGTAAAPTSTPTPIPEPSPVATVDPRLTTLYIGGDMEPNEFDPHVTVSSVTLYTIHPNMYESLLHYRPDGTLEPMLAESWEVSDDGLVYRFKLREDVRFSDGTPFNAEAVRAAFDRFFTLGIGFVSMFDMIDEVQVVDDYTVELRLKYPYAPLVAMLGASQSALFVSPTAVEQNEQGGDLAQGWMLDHTAGTGPFMLESWERQVGYQLVRNPYYREPPAPNDIQVVVYQLVREPATLRQLIEHGDIDIAQEILPSLLEPLRAADGVDVAVEDTISGGFGQSIVLNMTKEPFSDANFRRALAYAIDYDRLVEVWEGIAGPAEGPFPPSFSPWFSAEDVVQYHQDLDKATDYLREAGYDVPIDPPLKIEVIWQGGFTPQRDMCTLIKEDFAKIGIELEVVEAELPVWREAVWNKDFDLAFSQQVIRFPDPDSQVSMVLHSNQIRYKGWNFGYSNPRVDELIDLARQESDPEIRRGYYNEIQRLATDEVGQLWLVNKRHAFACRSNVTGIVWNSFYGQAFDANAIRKTEGS